MAKYFERKTLETTEVVFNAKKVKWDMPCIQVTHEAPKALRKTMLLMGRNMKIETKAFNVTPYSVALNEGADCIGYLLHDQTLGDYEEMYANIVGGACFRWRQYEGQNPNWWLQWVWIFPSYRNHGMFDRIKMDRNLSLMDKAWEVFERHHPEFIVEGPYSQAMRAFLKKSPDRMKRCPHPKWLEK